MTYTLEQLSADIKAALKADPGKGGKEAVCKLVSKVCLDKDFIAAYLTPENCKPRKVLYEDQATGQLTMLVQWDRKVLVSRLGHRDLALVAQVH